MPKVKQSRFELISYIFKSLKTYLLHSPNRKKAWLFFIGSILCVLAGVALTSVFSWWMTLFWGALNAMNASLFYTSLIYFVFIASAGVILDMLSNTLLSKLVMDWRNWLTHELISKFTKSDGNNFLHLARNTDEIDNPEQRIQQDVGRFVYMTVNLGLDLLKSSVKLATFIGTLWVVGGSLGFTISGSLIIIPGFLVWAALIFSGLGSYLSYLIGKKLPGLNKQKAEQEADFRKEMELVIHDAESIALEKGETYYFHSLTGKIDKIRKTESEQAKVNTRLAGFESIYYRLADVFPYIAASPLYFMGLIDLGQLMQISFSFDMVNDSLSWFIESYSKLSKYQSSVRRLMELEQVLNQPFQSSIQIQEHHSTELLVNGLALVEPKTQSSIIAGLNLNFRPHEHVLLEGSSGLGKSTFFKAVAGTWNMGAGEIKLPQDKKVCFLAQRPSIPHATLKQILAYPLNEAQYSPQEYQQVLQDVKLDKFIEVLSNEHQVQWSRRLSPGEQQRIAFARALLQKPDWLFLDESTASLDPATEARMYAVLKQKLPGTTLISIAHKETLKAHHDKVVRFVGMDEKGQIIVEESDLKQTQAVANDAFLKLTLSQP